MRSAFPYCRFAMSARARSRRRFRVGSNAVSARRKNTDRFSMPRAASCDAHPSMTAMSERL